MKVQYLLYNFDKITNAHCKLRFVVYLTKEGEMAKQFVWPDDRFSIGHNFLGHIVQCILGSIFVKSGLYGFQKTQNFMLVSKI
jgi:hypothetical protein